MDQHKQRRGKRKQAPLQHNLPVFCSQRQLAHLQQQRDESQFILFRLYPYMLDFEFNSMLNVLFFSATLRKCIRPEVSLQVSVILLHSVHECIQFARSFLKTKNKIYNPTSQKKLEKHGNQFLSLINFH